ncbi:MAG: hypothetical protein JXN59_00935, partial [Anaerolineae bacterium]|nr:hypothetical protein [Anaerolineae bacterium]
MLTFDIPPHYTRLTGDWEVTPGPLEADPQAVPPGERTLRVPECAHLQPVLYPEQPYWGDHLRAINEQAWFYRKTFTVEPVDYRRARLRFEGADYFAAVWLNGQFVGEHEGSFEPFTLDVTAALRPDGPNELVVRLSSPWDPPNPRGAYPINHVLRGLVKGHYEHGEGVIPPNVNPIGLWR